MPAGPQKALFEHGSGIMGGTLLVAELFCRIGGWGIPLPPFGETLNNKKPLEPTEENGWE